MRALLIVLMKNYLRLSTLLKRGNGGIIRTLILIIGIIFAQGLHASPQKLFESDQFPLHIEKSDWTFYTMPAGAPEDIAGVLQTKKTQADNPLFIAKKDDAPFYGQCVFENSEMPMEDYLALLYTRLNEKGISIKQVRSSSRKDTYVWIYEGNANGLPLRFHEVTTKISGTYFRFILWSLAPLAHKYEDEFYSFIDEIAIASEIEKNNGNVTWDRSFKDIRSTLSGDNLSYIPVEEDSISGDSRDNYPLSSSVVKREGLPGATFYTIKRKGKTAYLMGSIHYGLPDFYPFPTFIEAAYKKSHHLVLEVDVRPDRIKEHIEYMKKKMFLPEGRTLEAVLSKEMFMKLKETLGNFGLSIDKFQTHQPWAVGMVIQSFRIMSEGFSREEGVENYFIKNLGERDIVELENFRDQIDLFEHLNSEMQLAVSLNSYKQANTNLRKITAAWRRGDEKKLNEILIEKPYSIVTDDDEFQEAFLFRRNEKMAAKIEELLREDDGPYFIVVGTAHLVGERGLVDLLAKKGYQLSKFEGERNGAMAVEESSEKIEAVFEPEQKRRRLPADQTGGVYFHRNGVKPRFFVR